jgi:hypothetical protein
MKRKGTRRRKMEGKTKCRDPLMRRENKEGGETAGIKGRGLARATLHRKSCPSDFPGIISKTAPCVKVAFPPSPFPIPPSLSPFPFPLPLPPLCPSLRSFVSPSLRPFVHSSLHPFNPLSLRPFVLCPLPRSGWIPSSGVPPGCFLLFFPAEHGWTKKTTVYKSDMKVRDAVEKEALKRGMKTLDLEIFNISESRISSETRMDEIPDRLVLIKIKRGKEFPEKKKLLDFFTVLSLSSQTYIPIIFSLEIQFFKF